jgi:phenylacetate-coenzyme A ligase PaaK-like adenylate-forming protein
MPDDLTPAPDAEARLFLETSLDALLRPGETGDGSREALALFHTVARDVPAYRSLLAEKNISPGSIAAKADFARLPLLDKKNYNRRFTLDELVLGGKLTRCDFFAVSSGSTGEPTFWPRAQADEYPVAVRFEQVFHDAFRAHEKRTLAVICFALGTWVGGMFTASCMRHLSAKGYPVVTATPGNKIEEILRVVQRLGPQFEQTVLLGYPPFLKEVVDAGRAQGLDWSPFKVKLVMAGEVFSETWRDLVSERLGGGDPLRTSASIYGTADAGVLGQETPVSIAIRRFLAERPQAAQEMFGDTRLPTLCQYDPTARYFESLDGSLAFSGWNGVPLVRYHIADRGGVLSYDAMLQKIRALGHDPVATVRSTGGPEPRRQPFVWVFGRTDFTVSFFGANVFPETISLGLEQPEVSARVTGKFVMQVKEGLGDDKPRLTVAVELAKDATADDALVEAVAAAILAQLRRLNSEFANYVPAELQAPLVTLYPTGHPDYFPVGVKHRYSRKPA